MRAKKKKKILLIMLIVVIVLAIVGTLVSLYIYTDMFKSNKTLFAKYIGQTLENAENIYKDVGNIPYNEWIKDSKYTSQAKVKIHYTEGIGTSIENSKNPINQLQLNINGQTDDANLYNYQEIELSNKQEEVAKIEYLQDNDIYGIKFSDLFNQYISCNEDDLEKFVNISTDINFDLLNKFEFSEQEKENLQTKYLSIINLNVPNESFSKQSNQAIQIDEKDINANAYSIVLTKEKLNDLIIKILEEVKQDETLMSKFGEFDNIDEVITNINKSNIGEEESKIVVYETEETTVRITIQNPDYKIDLDILQDETENYISLSYEDIANDEKKVVTYKKTSTELSIGFTTKEDDETKEYNFALSDDLQENKAIRNFTILYEDVENKVQATIEQTIDKVEELEDVEEFTEENAINLSELNEEQAATIQDTVNTAVTEKVNDILTNVITLNDFTDILETIGVVPEQQDIQSSGVTETEKNRFNSQFEILKGEDLKSENMLRLIDAIKNNFINIQVTSPTEVKLIIDRFSSNEDMVETLTSFIEENGNISYDVDIGYDEITGLVNAILVTVKEG